jgi:hypothetical protein
MKDKKRKGSFHDLLPYFSFLLIGCVSHSSPPTQPVAVRVAQNQPSNTPPVAGDRRWHSAAYRGLEVGKSRRQEMLRVLGKPKSSVVPQARITTNPNTIIAYSYGGPPGYTGNLVVGVEKASGLIAWIETTPEHAFEEDMIKQFGSDHVLVGYKRDDCFLDGQYAMPYETTADPMNPFTRMEYRQLGITIQFNQKEVYRIVYISDKWPYGNPASICGQPQKGVAYFACGCGCCGGVQPKRQCLYRSKGDNLEAIIQNDKESKKNPGCALAGCSLGTKYVYCD